MVRMTRYALCALAALTAACATGPQYRTFYDFVPPTTAEGRSCVFQCENTKMQCSQLEEMRVANCEDRADYRHGQCMDRAQDAYQRCQQSGNQYCVQSYCARESCSYSSRCENQYNRCFEVCGGEILSETRCVKNCEAIQ